ncbi:hypothetical protein K438DRAFT_1957894 [Mycena galopus ATCC 62051]|nr:hypothetical protein K438DRAFT_1957894 [Mycena galopus ATCC 62051]
MTTTPMPTVSADDSDTAVRVLEHIMLHVALALLRGGASPVIVTTRFPEDALQRTLEADYNSWSSDSNIIQADFTSPSSIQSAIQTTVPIPPTEQQRLIAGEESLVTADHHALAVIDRVLITTGVANSWEARYNEFPYESSWMSSPSS